MKPSTSAYALLHGYCSNQSTVRILQVITKETNPLYGIKIRAQFSHIVYTGQTCGFLTSAMTALVQMWEVTEPG
jgi:hypothetical protein